MNRRLYVGNLPFSHREEDVRALFSQYGKVTEVNLIIDRMTGQSRGFAFVTMENPEESKEAIDKLHGTKVEGRSLVVNEAKPKEERFTPSGPGSGSGGFRKRDRR
ncbi:MAG: RNA-binding protein [Methylacidiphilaceae bacterium]|nr:RNA-binding protein [Candidatus Methylacidiphilaceae bacterium]